MFFKQLKLWKIDTAELTTSLTSEECFRALDAAVGSSWSLVSSGPWTGSVHRNGFRFRKNIDNYRNSFQPWVTGEFSASEAGTEVRCSFGLHALVQGFLIIWFGGVCLAALFLVPVAILGLFAGTGAEAGELAMMALTPPGMLVFGFGLVKFGSHLARNEPEEILDFLCQSLEASERGD